MTISRVEVEVNGVTSTLSFNSTSGKWEGSLTAPSQSSGSNNAGQGPGIGPNATNGYYPVVVRAYDEAGNLAEETVSGSFANALKLKVLERTAPVASIQYPSAGANIGNNAQPTIRFRLTDGGSGINPSTVKIVLDGTEYVPSTSQFDTDGEVLDCTFTPASSLADGVHEITVKGSDYDGNAATEISSTFKVDTTPPVLNVTYPTQGLLTNQGRIMVTGSTNDVTSTPVTLQVTIGSQSYTPEVGQTGAFSQQVQLTEGSNTITIRAVDNAGLETTVTRTVIYDGTPPVFASIVLTPNPVDASTAFSITVEVTDP